MYVHMPLTFITKPFCLFTQVHAASNDCYSRLMAFTVLVYRALRSLLLFGLVSITHTYVAINDKAMAIDDTNYSSYIVTAVELV